MIEPIPFQADRFRSAAAHYLQGRPAYSPALMRDVATLCGLDGTGHLLDLGCGPGQIALALRPYVAVATGMDPEPEMLALATCMAAEAGQDITFEAGSSQDLRPGMGPFRLVSIGRAFHWMDRPETARRLDGLIERGGALVLFHSRHAEVADNGWMTDFRRLLDHATKDGLRRHWREPGWVTHDQVLLNSAFSDLHQVSVMERRRVPATSLVDRALSMSTSTRERLGDGVAALRRDIEALAEGVAVDGLVTEVVESVALIARRPQG
jgi:SAM-dependent methyltransferase